VGCRDGGRWEAERVRERIVRVARCGRMRGAARAKG
jgi:hypothetical protein